MEAEDLVGQEAIAVLIPPMKEYMILDGPHRRGGEHFRCSDECPFMRAPHEPCSIGLGELKSTIFMGCDYGKSLFPGPDCPASHREIKS